MRQSLLKLFILFNATAFTQSSHPLFYIDTLKSNYRIGGSLDSIDLMLGSASTTWTGGGWNNAENSMNPQFLAENPNGQRFYSFLSKSALTFSGLPHIGFSYSFGSKGTQFTALDYHQTFKHGFIVNMKYQKFRSNGFYRKGNFDHNNLYASIFRKGKIYSLGFNATYVSSNAESNGGLLVDTLPRYYDLIFLPVRKEDASLKTKRSFIEAENYFNFLNDSLRAMGLYTGHTLRIKEYRYQEQSDTLSSIYSQINIDSTQTSDAHQWTQIGNGAGVYFKFKNIFFQSGLEANYWDFRNLGRFRDTLEINLTSEINMKIGEVWLNNSLDFNIIGARNEFVNTTNIKGTISRFKFWAKASIENKLPDYHMRYAVGNNYENISGNWVKQQRIYLSANISTHFWKTEPLLTYHFYSGRNNYFFDDSLWSNDVLSNFSMHQFTLRMPLSIRWFRFQPSYSFSLTPEKTQILPQHLCLVRCMIEGSLFKAKKMKAYAGIDFSWLSAFKRTAYADNMSAFNFHHLSEKLNGYNNLHAFFGFQIDEFKFYFRFENIGIFWNDRANSVGQNFSLPSQQFRLGITWDFFN